MKAPADYRRFTPTPGPSPVEGEGSDATYTSRRD